MKLTFDCERSNEALLMLTMWDAIKIDSPISKTEVDDSITVQDNMAWMLDLLCMVCQRLEEYESEPKYQIVYMAQMHSIGEGHGTR